jgi:hypothetical protein
MTGNDIWSEMESESTSTTGFWKPSVGKINQILMLTDPVRQMSSFKNGENRPQYIFLVASTDAPKVALQWGVSSKSAQQQIVAVVKANKLSSVIGAVLQVGVSGEGMDRRYTVLPVSLPTPASIAQVATDFPKATLEKEFPKLFGGEIKKA